MLISQVLNARAIAAVATSDASNQLPYLGTQWFPDRKKAGLDLRWVKTHNGLPVTLKPSNFDAIPVLRAREGLNVEQTQMAFFRESMQIGEQDEQDLMRVVDATDPYLASALASIYDDTTRLVRGAEVVPEIMRMQLLTGQNITLTSDGVNYTYDYDPNNTWAANNYTGLTGTSVWTNAQSTPLDDINAMRKALAKKGRVARYVLMNSTTFGYLSANAQIQSAILAQNLTANVYVNDEVVRQVVRSNTGLDIVIYDKMYTDYTGTEQNFYPDNYVTLLPAEGVGYTWFGTTPEERTAIQVADVDVAMYGVGIAVAVKTEYGPPAKTLTTASEIVLPSFEGMDGVGVIKVA